MVKINIEDISMEDEIVILQIFILFGLSTIICICYLFIFCYKYFNYY